LEWSQSIQPNQEWSHSQEFQTPYTLILCRVGLSFGLGLMSRVYSTVQSSCGNIIQPCIVSCIDFSFKFIFSDGQKFRFSLNFSKDLSHYLCFRVSHLMIELRLTEV